MTAKELCMQALQCLYLEVDKSIADDVKAKVVNAIQEAEQAEKKIEAIKKIAKLHPTTGLHLGWSYYTGGMEDRGDWYYLKLLEVPLDALERFLENKSH